MSQPYDAFHTASSSSRLAGELGHILSSVHNPVTRGLGMGLRAASAMQHAQAMGGRQAGPIPTTGGGDSILDQPVDLSSGVPGMAAARASLQGEDVRTLLGRRGMTEPQATQALEGGLQMGANAMLAAQEHLGMGAGRFLHDLGYSRLPLEQASGQFLRQAAQRYAFGDPAPWLKQAAPFAAPPDRPGAQDVAATLEILANRPVEARLATPQGIATMARLGYTLRAAQVYPTPAAVAQAASSYGQGDLLDWMDSALGQLAAPPASLVEEIRQLRIPNDPTRGQGL